MIEVLTAYLNLKGELVFSYVIGVQEAEGGVRERSYSPQMRFTTGPRQTAVLSLHSGSYAYSTVSSCMEVYGRWKYMCLAH